ncbi:uncharacterized protein MELLADRAFT_59809 [Melampsora larici-populina 98AG31]|uniref:Uncharacterized protein n=1 Tax=Melampsora larici-populina (strain 98AG31 / pathotype 3-4-7) TaxID=747676 RepID=F4R8V3_MELLP|nr:uncharacterized protein MELLADRAFT_59809 [Melampsora larici-populina 98AG31]EGG10874.1 hypothetical protein MELLADRAFT_59809 [Melampsora larici-populina 98AG31]
MRDTEYPKVVRALEERVEHLEKKGACSSDPQEHVILQIQQDPQKSTERYIQDGIKEGLETLHVKVNRLRLQLKEANDAIDYNVVLVSLLGESNVDEEGADDDHSSSGSGFGTNDLCT